ncbi:MAG TPA: serine hydrolase domain-containing protein [Mycobacteriales bacterium]
MDPFTALTGEMAAPGNPPGSAAAVLVRGEVVRTLTAGCCGSARPNRVRADTVFPLMSMSKAVTAVAALALAERGALAVDDPVGRHLPAIGRMLVDGRPPAEPIRIRHLLTHTSGLIRWMGAHPVEQAYGEVGIRPGQPGDYSLAEFCDRLAGTGLAFDPGTGLGVAVDEDAGHPGEYGWSGASGSVFFVHPGSELALVVLANRFGPGNAAWRNRLRTLAYRVPR